MRKLILLAALLFATGAHAETIKHNGATYYVIDVHDGGDVNVMQWSLDWAKAHKVHFALRGECYSSCTMALQDPLFCVGPRAILGFHAGSTALATMAMWSSYPANLRSWLTARGGLRHSGGNDMGLDPLGHAVGYRSDNISPKLYGDELRAIVRPCPFEL